MNDHVSQDLRIFVLLIKFTHFGLMVSIGLHFQIRADSDQRLSFDRPEFVLLVSRSFIYHGFTFSQNRNRIFGFHQFSKQW